MKHQKVDAEGKDSKLALYYLIYKFLDQCEEIFKNAYILKQIYSQESTTQNNVESIHVTEI